MPKFKVTIEEHYTKEIIVEAESLEEAEEEVETNYICGDIKVIDERIPDSLNPTVALICTDAIDTDDIRGAYGTDFHKIFGG
jgi:hypothetical protein